MPTYRATNLATHEVVEYEEPTARTEHLGQPWFLERMIPPPESPGLPPDVVPYTGSWRITKRAFRARFTEAEKIAVEIASLDDPVASMQLRGLAATLRARQREISDSPYVDLQFAPTREGTQVLENYGLLSPGRAAEILDTPPAIEELFNG